jgi:MEDS: MEthanogen/methylotroph, DcmR Sensory domain
MVKPVLDGNIECILRELIQADYGEHNLLIYPDLTTLKQIYSKYFKSRLENNREIILFLSTYQSVDSVRRTLRTMDLDVAKYEENGSLVIVDSVRGYFGSESDVLSFVKVISKSAQNQGRSGCSVIADMGSFYLVRKVQELLKYEAYLPLKFGVYEKSLIRCKGFCSYHQKDFNRLSEREKQSLFEHHYRNLIITDEIKVDHQR